MQTGAYGNEVFRIPAVGARNVCHLEDGRIHSPVRLLSAGPIAFMIAAGIGTILI